MEDQQFHSVDPDQLKTITVEDVEAGHIFPGQTLDYSVPVPTYRISLPHSNQGSWWTVEAGYDTTVIPEIKSGGWIQ
ncbi:MULTISPECIES: hypothetical protein [unclassified Leptolyngbya]|uniref:hypothetical protein n=1 Tax=unclassified Leptolyngbya TaxID=2650499 RepID=UPI001688EF94|nr:MULTISPECIES: hypothetical protein [unclassified Leptolyngbya]MBD1909999.1 hypothetical protein [Leptolyngbya sp. FACHB-8]MBD2157136.1 hypothetical protein [Leptolyngbya sp. FACHB-16]